MKTLLKLALALILIVAPLRLLAHASHESFDAIDAMQATQLANQLVQSLVSSKKLPDSWKNAKSAATTTRETNYGPVWLVTFQNTEEQNTAKKSLYVFLDELGNPVAVNHEGKLD